VRHTTLSKPALGQWRESEVAARICIVLAHGGTAGLGDKDVLVCADVVLQEPVGNDHVDPGRLQPSAASGSTGSESEQPKRDEGACVQAASR
jgi:hypothetical protein